MKVLDVSANQVWCETFRLGLDISSAVCDGCHSTEVVEATPHKDSIASPVSSITPTFTRSAVVPSFFNTVMCQLYTLVTCDDPDTFLACTDALHNDKDFRFRHLSATMSEILQGHESGLITQWLSAKLGELWIIEYKDMAALVLFWKDLDVQRCDGAREDTSISVGDISSPYCNKLAYSQAVRDTRVREFDLREFSISSCRHNAETLTVTALVLSLTTRWTDPLAPFGNFALGELSNRLTMRPTILIRFGPDTSASMSYSS